MTEFFVELLELHVLGLPRLGRGDSAAAEHNLRSHASRRTCNGDRGYVIGRRPMGRAGGGMDRLGLESELLLVLLHPSIVITTSTLLLLGHLGMVIGGVVVRCLSMIHVMLRRGRRIRVLLVLLLLVHVCGRVLVLLGLVSLHAVRHLGICSAVHSLALLWLLVGIGIPGGWLAALLLLLLLRMRILPTV